MVIYDPPLEIEFLPAWREYEAELDPVRDAEELARTKAVIARKIARGDVELEQKVIAERKIAAERGLKQA